MMNTICKSHANGARCPNCEMQSTDDHGINYVKIRPKTNKDAYQSQIVRRINITPINNMAMRKIDLATTATNELYLNKRRRRACGLCGVNCYQKHNLMSSLSMLPLHFRSTVDDTIHWLRQNYERDCVSNVKGFTCGCGKNWEVNNDGSRQLHDLTKCVWNKAAGDVICSDYNKSTNHALNTIKFYLDLAVKSTCRCLPSMTLVKHGQVKASRIRLSDHLNHLLVQDNCYCPWREANCGNFCTTRLHYCGIQHEP